MPMKWWEGIRKKSGWWVISQPEWREWTVKIRANEFFSRKQFDPVFRNALRDERFTLLFADLDLCVLQLRFFEDGSVSVESWGAMIVKIIPTTKTAEIELIEAIKMPRP